MNKNLYMPVLLAGVVAFSSCNKKIGEMDATFFNVSPMPLVAVGGDVPATINGSFPEKFFEKKSTLTITPVLVYEGGEVKGTPFTYQGEDAEGNYTTIAYDEGGNIAMKAEFDYIPEMRQSELFLDFTAAKGEKEYALPRVKVADGVVAVSEIANAAGITPAIAADEFKRVTVENFVAKILFNIQQANVRSSQLNTVEMKDVKAAMKNAENAENQSVLSINIASTASPDGPLELNERLAENREKNTETQINRIIKADKLNTEVFGEFLAEDWAGFQELMEASNIQDKELILRVLQNSDPEEREKEIKNLAAAFTQIADDILPKLRYSKVTAAIETVGKTDAEIVLLSKSEPKALNVEELLYSATLTNDEGEKMDIYEDATKIFPSDYRAFNNIGRIHFENGELAKAEAMFNKAKSINPTAEEVAMNLGMIALANEDIAKAEQLFGQASGVEELAGALGTLYTEKGDYKKAVQAFGNTYTNNAAVAQICANELSKAESTLNKVDNKDAVTYYLKAVIAARQNDGGDVISNLKECIKLDNSMLNTILTDIEFTKYGVDKLLK